MKGRDNVIFWLLLILATIIGGLLYDIKFDSYSEIITFLSIMVGFKITSLSILFNSALKKTLYDRRIEKYGTELHRLKDFYKHALMFEVLSILLIFTVPDIICEILLNSHSIAIGRHLLVLPILIGVFYCFHKILYDLLRIFVHPTNE